MNQNIFLLAVCQALMMAVTSLSMTSSALVGLEIAPIEKLATLPLGLCYATVMIMLIPTSLMMQKYGRRVGFSIGACFGIVAGILAGVGIYYHLFLLFCIASVFLGVAMSTTQFYRFAAAEVADEAFKSRAISWVLAGGIVAAFLGPGIARWTQYSFTGPAFSASFASISILSLGVLLCQFALRIPVAAETKSEGSKRAIRSIITLPVFIVAVFGATVAYGVMNLLMTSTPLAMHGREISFDKTAIVIQWHIVGMFLPSFFTGNLIHKFGVIKVMISGVLFLLLCVVVSLFGSEFKHFMLALVALGIGWNFLYIGGTTLLTQVYQPAEKGMVQGINDFLVFSAVALTAFISGYLHHLLGWENLNVATVPVVVLAGVAVLYLGWLQKKQ